MLRRLVAGCSRYLDSLVVDYGRLIRESRVACLEASNWLVLLSLQKVSAAHGVALLPNTVRFATDPLDT